MQTFLQNLKTELDKMFSNETSMHVFGVPKERNLS